MTPPSSGSVAQTPPMQNPYPQWMSGMARLACWIPGRNATLWLEETERWPAIKEQLLTWVTTLIQQIRRGAFPLAPRSEHCTQTCPYGQICRIGQSRRVGKVHPLPLPGTQEKA